MDYADQCDKGLGLYSMEQEGASASVQDRTFRLKVANSTPVQ